MDLHLHTVLSACAEIEMLPPLIVERALELGLAAIAITDHNSAENAGAVREAALGSGLVVFPGMELRTREEVDLLALFEEEGAALALQERVYQALGEDRNRPEFFGEQIVVDAEGNPIRQCNRLLQRALPFPIGPAVELVKSLGGLCIAAHADRPTYGIVSNLGFIPPGLPLDGVEISRYSEVDAFRQGTPGAAGLGVASFGDAHRLSEISDRTEMWLEDATLGEVDLAFRQAAGRRLRVRPDRHREQS